MWRFTTNTILTGIMVINLIATGYALTVVNRHQKAIETAGNAFGQVADTFIQSGIVEVGQDNNFSVNQVITAKDVQQAQQSFNAPPPIQ